MPLLAIRFFVTALSEGVGTLTVLKVLVALIQILELRTLFSLHVSKWLIAEFAEGYKLVCAAAATLRVLLVVLQTF